MMKSSQEGPHTIVSDEHSLHELNDGTSKISLKDSLCGNNQSEMCLVLPETNHIKLNFFATNPVRSEISK